MIVAELEPVCKVRSVLY